MMGEKSMFEDFRARVERIPLPLTTMRRLYSANPRRNRWRRYLLARRFLA